MNSRKPFIAGNWKMYKTCSEAVETAGKLVKLLSQTSDVDIMIAPAYIALAQVHEAVKGSCVMLGAQNLFWEKKGAYTGEISPIIIYVHPAETIISGDINETVNKKIKAAISYNLKPVFCIGESEKEREANDTFNVLDKQVKIGLEGLSQDNMQNVTLAYEPVWAIGTGKTASSEQAQEVHLFLRNLIEKLFGENIAESIRILYGGSVKPENIAELMTMPDVDGALVGGASLDADKFMRIVKFKTVG